MKGLVLVTGASGFIGRRLVLSLAREGWEVRAAARTRDAVPGARGVHPVALGDISQPVEWRRLVNGATQVVHLAGLAHANPHVPEARYIEVNARPVGTLAEAARDAGVKRVLLVSSVRAQTGATAAEVVAERMTPAPSDAYGRSKLAAERILADALTGTSTDWTVLRPVLVYGEGVAGNMRSLVSLARSPLPLPFASLAGHRSLLSIDNLASAVMFLLSADAASRRIFLLADPEPVTVADVARTIRSALRRPARLVRVPTGAMALASRMLGLREAWDRLAGDLVVDTAALRALGWRPLESTAEGLSRWMHAEALSERQVSRPYPDSSSLR